MSTLGTPCALSETLPKEDENWAAYQVAFFAAFFLGEKLAADCSRRIKISKPPIIQSSMNRQEVSCLGSAVSWRCGARRPTLWLDLAVSNLQSASFGTQCPRLTSIMTQHTLAAVVLWLFEGDEMKMGSDSMSLRVMGAPRGVYGG
jgi:hypothetical protein